MESILRPIDPNYKCTAFRAANWSVSPATNVAKALLDNDITIDTSVFKYGRRDGLVTFDYSGAYSDLLPWPANTKDFCVRDDQSRLWEFPIYCENRWIGAFLSANQANLSSGSRASSSYCSFVLGNRIVRANNQTAPTRFCGSIGGNHAASCVEGGF